MPALNTTTFLSIFCRHDFLAAVSHHFYLRDTLNYTLLFMSVLIRHGLLVCSFPCCLILVFMAGLNYSCLPCFFGCRFTVLHCWITALSQAFLLFNFFIFIFIFYKAYTHRLLLCISLFMFLALLFVINRTMYHHNLLGYGFYGNQGKKFCITVTRSYDLDSFLCSLLFVFLISRYHSRWGDKRELSLANGGP